jgi:hypothetical protein
MHGPAQAQDPVAHEQAQGGGHLVVAGAGQVDALAGVAQAVGEGMLQGGVAILLLREDGQLAFQGLQAQGGQGLD